MKDLKELTVKELKAVIKEAEGLIRLKSYEESDARESNSRAKLKVGDMIETSSDRFIGEKLEVLKLNSKKVKCRRDNGDVWNIPYSNIIL